LKGGEALSSPSGEYFGCRYCYNLTYSSCQESHKHDSFYKQFAFGMHESIPGFSKTDAKRALDSLEERLEHESALEIINRRIAELEEEERKKEEKLLKYLTADELCRQSGLAKDEFEKLEQCCLLVSDTKEGKYRPKLVGWGKKLKDKLSKGWTYEEIKQWKKRKVE
jgi:hypothetical protein